MHRRDMSVRRTGRQCVSRRKIGEHQARLDSKGEESNHKPQLAGLPHRGRCGTSLTNHRQDQLGGGG